MAERTKLKPHPLIRKLGVEAGEPARAVLVGYLGPASQPGYWRVYHSLTFSDYTEVPEEAIERTEPLDAADENSPSLVLIKPGTRAYSVLGASHTLEAGFLEGPIAGRYLRGASAGPRQPVETPQTGSIIVCPTGTGVSNAITCP